MASMSIQEKMKVLDKLSDGINAKAGKTIVGRVGRNEDLKDKLTIKFIETPSQNLNVTFGGGFPRRRTSIVAGMHDSGKTSLLLETIGYNMQKDPNFMAGWLESEGSLDLKQISEVFKIDLDRFYYMEHDRNGAGEGALDKVEAALATGAFDIMVINSLKCLVPSEEFRKQMGDVQVGAQARMNAKMTRKFTAIVSENDTAFVIITHLTTQIGSMSRDPLIVSGGNAIMYAASLVADLRKRSIQEGDPISKEDGIKIGVSVKKNHCVPTRNPYVKCDYYAIFGEGIERYLEALELAVAQGVIFKAGAFIKDLDEQGEPKILADGTKLQWQGAKNFREYCKNNSNYFEEILARIKGITVQMTAEEIDGVEKETQEIEASVPEDVIADATSKKSKKRN